MSSHKGYGDRHSRGGHHGPPSDNSPRNVAGLWSGYLDAGYFDAQGNLKPEYVSRENLIPLVRAMCNDPRSGLTSHQIRRYFGHCRAIETRLKSPAGDATWENAISKVKKLDIAAADGAAKNPPKIPELFHDFIKCNVAATRTQKDFLEGFLPHFEALVGFGTAFFAKERN